MYYYYGFSDTNTYFIKFATVLQIHSTYGLSEIYPIHSAFNSFFQYVLCPKVDQDVLVKKAVERLYIILPSS